MASLCARLLNVPHPALPTFAEAEALICRCERGEDAAALSWLEYADARGIYHYPTVEYVLALAAEIKRLGPRQAIEVAAGDGALARGLNAAGLDVAPTDAYSTNRDVAQFASADALAAFQPDLVIGCWTPIDSGIDAQVMGFPSVQWYIYIGHEHNGVVGHERLWRTPGWRHRRLETADAANLGRTDFCQALDPPRIAQHGWTVVFERAESL